MTDREPILSLVRKDGERIEFFSFGEIRDKLKNDLNSLHRIRSEIVGIGEKPSQEFENYLIAYRDVANRAEGIARKPAVSSGMGKAFLDSIQSFFQGRAIHSLRFQPECYHDVEDALNRSDVFSVDTKLSELLGLEAAIYNENHDHANVFKAGLVGTARNDPLYADIYDRIDDLSNRLGSGEDHIEKVEGEQRSQSSKLSGLEEEQAAFLKRANKTLEKTENARSALQEKLALKQASVYWKNKSILHVKRQKYWAIGLGAWLIASIVALACSLDHYREHVMDAYSIFDLVPYLPSNILLITLAVWGTRVLIRQVLSELHLATRAEEKETLIQTYLALINEGAAKEEDRHIILTPIFSLSQDGLVEDDGLPPHASLLSAITGKN